MCHIIFLAHGFDQYVVAVETPGSMTYRQTLLAVDVHPEWLFGDFVISVTPGAR